MNLRPLTQTLRWIERHATLVFGLGFCLLATALYFVFTSPADYLQGESVRMMYVHVPAAWMAMGIYSFITLCSLSSFIWKNPIAHILASESAAIGLLFTGLCLITGSLWGKPTWGAWWVWDARLTSVLVLFFIYAAYLFLTQEAKHNRAFERISALFAIVGAINIPIIKFSVEWWNTLHQPASVSRIDAPAIHHTMLTPLLLMFAVYALFFLLTLTFRVRAAQMERKIVRLQHQKIASK